MNILIIGGGNMGLTYAQAFVRGHIATKEQMMILERTDEKASRLESKTLGRTFTDASKCLPHSDLIILAVKPQDSQALFRQIKPFVEEQQVFLSIMAGIKIQTIREGLGVNKVIRAMPNLPAQIGQGMTVFTASDEVTRLELVMVQNLLSTTGKTVYVQNEDLVDASTAISGSGPAYIYFFMDALMKAALGMGFSSSESELLVAQTFTGAIDLYNKSDLSPLDWIAKVASKGGTTEAALGAFHKNSLSEAIGEGAFAAFQRAKELGKK
jgi:pyrroline-5-carboxylate reductase